MRFEIGAGTKFLEENSNLHEIEFKGLFHQPPPLEEEKPLLNRRINNTKNTFFVN